MIIALILFGYATAALVAGAPMLARARWTARAPRLGIAAWLAWLASVLGAVALGGLALTVPTALVSRSLAQLLHACVMALQAWYATPGGTVMATAGVLLSTLVAGRIAYSTAMITRTTRRERRRHRDTLALIGTPHPATGSTLVEHDRPAAYCVPGRPHRVVVTTGALATLDDRQLAGVLAHERAHLHGRHHLLLGAFTVAHRAVPLPALHTAANSVAALVEMLADDRAGHTAERLDIAEALLTLAGAPVPQAALGAGTSAGTRVRRLLAPHRPLNLIGRAMAIALASLAVALPAAVAAQPAFAAQALPYCPTGEQSAMAGAGPCEVDHGASGNPLTGSADPCPR